MQCELILKYVDIIMQTMVQINCAEFMYFLLIMKWNYFPIVCIFDYVYIQCIIQMHGEYPTHVFRGTSLHGIMALLQQVDLWTGLCAFCKMRLHVGLQRILSDII